MHSYDTVSRPTYISVMLMMPAVTKKDVQETSEKSILYDIPNTQLVDYKEKMMHTL